jgi:hypothetical protein
LLVSCFSYTSAAKIEAIRPSEAPANSPLAAGFLLVPFGFFFGLLFGLKLEEIFFSETLMNYRTTER